MFKAIKTILIAIASLTAIVIGCRTATFTPQTNLEPLSSKIININVSVDDSTLIISNMKCQHDSHSTIRILDNGDDEYQERRTINRRHLKPGRHTIVIILIKSTKIVDIQTFMVTV